MGLVLLDLTFRVEKAFRIRMPKEMVWMERLGFRKPGDDATLAQYHAMILELCAEQSVIPPQNSWEILRERVSDATGLNLAEVTEQTRIVNDIAPHG